LNLNGEEKTWTSTYTKLSTTLGLTLMREF